MQALFPAAPFEYDFLESAYERQYHPFSNLKHWQNISQCSPLSIACLGLFALSYFSVQKRIREVAVRKVFGAGIFDVLLLLSKNYLKISVISCLLGSLLAFYLMTEWLQNFAFAIHLGLADFLIPLIAITAVVTLTVSYNCCRTSLINPSHSLKHN